ncbi:MAG TPA: hypothetical protein VJH24_05075 [Candidatus Bilamarchaeaceae archaeon]|nr:hypothetical protein [Candidatus Bilamarchaeaceae archaeon]
MYPEETVAESKGKKEARILKKLIVKREENCEQKALYDKKGKIVIGFG